MTRVWAFYLHQRLLFAQQPIGKKGYSQGQLIFSRDMIHLIKHTEDWELIRQQKHMQINKDNIRENKHID